MARLLELAGLVEAQGERGGGGEDDGGGRHHARAPLDQPFGRLDVGEEGRNLLEARLRAVEKAAVAEEDHGKDEEQHDDRGQELRGLGLAEAEIDRRHDGGHG